MMNWKGFGRKQSWSNFKGLSRHSPGGTKEHENLSLNSLSPGRDLNSGPPEYEVLTTRPRISVVRRTVLCLLPCLYCKFSLVQRSPTVCLYVCDQETAKREAKGPSWTISACELMNTASFQCHEKGFKCLSFSF
jgi:hypothetical protein